MKNLGGLCATILLWSWGVFAAPTPNISNRSDFEIPIEKALDQPENLANVASRISETRLARPQGYLRTLNGHVFLPSAYLANPFPTNNLAVGIEWASSNLTDPALEAAIKTYGVSPSFNYRGSKNAWSFDFSLSAILLSGSDAYSAFISGASATYRAEAGVFYSLFRSQRMSAQLGVSYTTGSTLSFSPLTAVDASITNLQEANRARFLNSSPIQELSPRFSLAYASSPVFGVLLEGGSLFDLRTGKVAFVKAAAKLDFDLKTMRIPLGFSGFYVAKLGIGGTTTSQIYGIGIFDRLTPAFSAGLELSRLDRSDASLSALLSATYYYP
ncbi:hypothetical protein K2X30_07900 [bacterium]|nr:hypothetical protein [bacterium]